MNQAWIGVIGTLFGVSIGGLVTYLVNFAQFKRDKKLKEQQLIQQKLEEICETAEEVRRSFTGITSQIASFVQFDKKIELDINPIRLNKLKMLIYFYAPSLKSLFNQLYDTARLHGETIASIFIGNPDDRTDLFIILVKLTQSLENQCTTIIEGSANIVRQHF